MENYKKYSNRLLIIDANHMANRAFFVHELCTTTGKDTSVLYGILSMLQSLCSQFRTDNFILVWDGYGRTFRHKIFNDYKIRHFTDDIKKREERVRRSDAIKLAIDGLTRLKIPMVKFDKIECDDVIGCLVNNRCHGNIKHKIIVSDDKDFYQLVQGEKVLLWRAIKEQLVTEKWLQDEYKLKPNQWIELKAMVGESATQDNIPGLTRCGEKTALKLLWENNSLSKIHEWLKIEAIKPKAGKNVKVWLEEFNRGVINRAYELSKICCDPELLFGSDVDRFNKGIVLQHSKVLTIQEIVTFKSTYEFGSLDTKSFGYTCGYNIVDSYNDVADTGSV